MSGLLTKQPDDPKTPSNQRYKVYLDEQGRPVTPQGAVYLMEISLSYLRDGSGGYAWLCNMQVWKLAGRYMILTNAANNQLSPEEWERLLDGRPDWVAFNDRDTVRAYDEQLDRTASAALTRTFRALNGGMTGTVQTQIQRPSRH